MSASHALSVDLSGLPGETLRVMEQEFRRGAQLNAVKAEVEQRSIGHANRREARATDGVGELKARISPESFHYWGQRLGYECWQDKAFLDEYLRDNPDSRVKSVGTRIQVGYRGNGPRFKKSYG